MSVGKTRTRLVSTLIIAFCMFFSCVAGVLVLALPIRASSDSVYSLVGRSTDDWEEISGSLNKSLVSGGITAAFQAAYGSGIKLNTPLKGLKEISFNLRFPENKLLADEWFCVTLGTGDYTFDHSNASGRGASFLIYKKADNAIQVANESVWKEFFFLEDNEITIKPGSTGWELHLKNKNVNGKIGEVPFDKAPAELFDDNSAFLRIYAYKGDAGEVKIRVTDVMAKVKAEGTQHQVFLKNTAGFSPIGDSEFDIEETDKGIKVSGTSVYGKGIASDKVFNTANEVSFRLKFINELPENGTLAIALGNENYQLAPDNNSQNGLVFLLEKKVEGVIQCNTNGSGSWLEFPKDEFNYLTIKKSESGWDLYLSNSVKNSPEKIGTVPFTAVPSNVFANDMAKLYFYTVANPASAVSEFVVEYMGHTVTTASENPGLPAGNVLDAYDLATYIRPYWTGNTVYHESALPMRDKDGTIKPIQLLYDATEIIQVCSSDLATVYQQGTDWVLDDGKLIIPEGSSIPVMSYSEYFPDSAGSSSFETLDGRYIYFSEGSVFHSKQIAITYKHNQSWNWSTPAYKGNLLQGTVNKLNNKQPLKVLFYGDSIATGVNSSGVTGAAPYAPSWTEMFVEALKARFGYSDITVVNTAVGGTTSAWGVENAQERVAAHQADLVVINFGMNDGNGNSISAQQLQNNLSQIISIAKSAKSTTEFILISPMLPNPLVKMTSGNQAEFEAAMLKLESQGVAVAPITTMFRYLMSRKEYADMTGNNVNHPNDFVARLYAQTLYATVVDTGPAKVYPEKTFVLPTNDSYWVAGDNAEVNNGTVTLGTSANAYYTGSLLKDRIAQFEAEADIPDNTWVGFLLKQSNPGLAPWDQSQAYLLIVRNNGAVELLKRKNGALNTIASGDASGFVSAGKLDRAVIRFGAVQEGDSQRIIFDINGTNIINYFDADSPILDHGYTGVMTLETASLKIYLGPNGSDSDDSSDQGRYGAGKGYLGGEINPEYLIDWPEVSDFEYTGKIDPETEKEPTKPTENGGGPSKPGKSPATGDTQRMFASLLFMISAICLVVLVLINKSQLSNLLRGKGAKS